MPRIRVLLIAAAALAVGACDDQGPILSPGGGSGAPLYAALWHAHEANGDTLPAEISNRYIGITNEIVMLDSAQLLVRSDSTYEQRYWYRVLHSTVLDRSEIVIDNGSYEVEGLGFRFNSDVRPRDFTVVVPAAGQVLSNEQMLYFEHDSPITTIRYRLTHP